jgi:peptidoglycan/xylan/chitin deacetylase (PgdA/CDA1 family)
LDNDTKIRHLLITVDGDWLPGSGPGLEAVLKVCDEYEARSTIFVTGRFADAYSSLVGGAASAGHEIGAHGWAHVFDMEENFATTSYEQQREWLLKGTEAVERATGARPGIFRAPYLQVSGTMLTLLEELGYRIDSSVPARRFDAGFGMVNGLGYFRAPLEAYHPDPRHPARRGDSPILEMPPSSFVFPINMTAMRVLGPRLTLWAARRVFNRGHTLNFYCHPWEFVAPERQEFPAAFPRRHRDTIGTHNLELLRRFLDRVLSWGYQPATISQVT